MNRPTTPTRRWVDGRDKRVCGRKWLRAIPKQIERFSDISNARNRLVRASHCLLLLFYYCVHIHNTTNGVPLMYSKGTRITQMASNSKWLPAEKEIEREQSKYNSEINIKKLGSCILIKRKGNNGSQPLSFSLYKVHFHRTRPPLLLRTT